MQMYSYPEVLRLLGRLLNLGIDQKDVCKDSPNHPAEFSQWPFCFSFSIQINQGLSDLIKPGEEKRYWNGKGGGIQIQG
jgi:hypothetical protein